MRMNLRTSLSMAVLGLATLAASCQVKPGEYRVYRVANQDTEESNGCYPSPPDIDVTGDSTTVRVGQTFAVFAADSETYFLDFENLSLAGNRDGNAYSFNGETVDVTLQGDSTITMTSILDIDLTIEGRKITGTSTLDVSSTCTGGMACPDPANTQCITTTKFDGSEMKDVELEHGV